MTVEAPVILHVEDEPDILEIAKFALEAIGGLEVVQCNSGFRALEVVAETVPDLFLLDVMMPGIDGIETLRSLRAIPGFEKTPAIFMTAKVMPEDQKLLMERGAISVIKKPFDPMTVAADIVEIWKESFQSRVKEQMPSE